jgi:hypothetical protein
LQEEFVETNATVKGLIFIGAKKWFAENKSPAEFEKFVQAFPENERDFWTKSTLMPITKVPASIYCNMYKIISAQLGELVFRTIAATVAFNDLGTFMRIFIKLGTPAFTANSFPGAFKQYFSAGEFKAVNVASHAAEFELLGAEPYGEAGCSGTLGWTRMALEYAGAKNLIADHAECRFHGRTRCVFRYRWE